ncbi:hypothetical protein A0H76_2197 [Hepatospora eriocheir]|uniref:ISXO2-like transposase domain-containing protein n=1 Tax=Hepatospora eriocheir TaxID=1081669 RepID=A0A1X0QG24_9MICR|nr:hypothetical protein A0H76_2197 [Hepatospora eriocheir]
MNYGERINGLWVFGMTEEGSRKVLMFVVERRDRNTLLPLLVEHINLKNIIHFDKWWEFSGLNAVFHNHKVVNHSENFVDSKTRYNTQLIKCIWVILN